MNQPAKKCSRGYYYRPGRYRLACLGFYSRYAAVLSQYLPGKPLNYFNTLLAAYKLPYVFIISNPVSLNPG
jgi:hypothetical protein